MDARYVLCPEHHAITTLVASIHSLHVSFAQLVFTIDITGDQRVELTLPDHTARDM